jgi:hypothetical protein
MKKHQGEHVPSYAVNGSKICLKVVLMDVGERDRFCMDSEKVFSLFFLDIFFFRILCSL